MDIGRTPIISKAASPSWCGSDVETNSEGQGIKALASAVFIGLFRFALGILPFRKLPLALFAVIVFPYLRDKKTSKSFYDSLRQFDLTGFSSDFRLFFRQRHFPFPWRRTRPAGRRKQGKGKLFPQPGPVISSRREWRGSVCFPDGFYVLVQTGMGTAAFIVDRSGAELVYVALIVSQDLLHGVAISGLGRVLTASGSSSRPL